MHHSKRAIVYNYLLLDDECSGGIFRQILLK